MFGWSENMSTVKSLPESVRSSVRSGIVLFDIARVVEELIFNSLDARASKVSVFVGIGTCYVKVVDDGTGITRDGLELVGERYVTSKFNNWVDMDSKNGSFGFRGEALASISDVSLLEIVTKSHGRPNGYRKVMKGSRCLYLGICDDIKDIGTTVVARDLFYNQPVRRKYIQSSPKKVLQSVKRSVLRIALVHSKVSFKVVDIESDEILLCTQASSPATLLSSCFGIDVSTSLHELNIDDGNLKLFGYISGPSDNLSVKAFQYVYIDSRFVSKGPIHKLVNQIASRFECNDLPKAANGTKNRKRSRPQTYPSFILNIRCPRSFYDLTFEPSKTYVEFKDWVPVLTFLDEAIQHLWEENISYGDSSEFATDLMGKDQILYREDNAMFAVDLEDKFFQGSSIVGKRKHTNHQASPDAISSDFKCPRKEDSCISDRKWDMSPIQYSYKHYGCFNEKEIELDFNSHSEQLGEYSFSKCMPEVSRSCKIMTHNSDVKFLRNDYFSENEAICGEKSIDNEYNDHPISLWAENFFECSPGKKIEPIGFELTRDFQQSSVVDMIRDVTEPFLRSCSSRGTLPPESYLFTESAHDSQSDGYKTSKILTSPCDGINISETENGKRSSVFSTRALWQDWAASFECFPTFKRKHFSASKLESFPGSVGPTIPFYEEQLEGKGGFSSGSVSKLETIGTGHAKSNSEWWSMTSDSYSYSTLWDDELCNDINGLKGKSSKTTRNKHCIDNEENNCRYGYTTSCSNSGLEDSGSIHSHQRRGLNINFSPKWADVLSDENDWLSFVSHGERYQSTVAYEAQRCRNDPETEGVSHISKVRIRSHSAPPFCRRKTRFAALHCCSTAEPDKGLACPEAQEHLKSIPVGCSMLDGRQDLKKSQDLKTAKKDSNKNEKFKQSVCLIQDAVPPKELEKFFEALQKRNVNSLNWQNIPETIFQEFQDSPNCWTKWRTQCSKTSGNNKLHNIHDQNNILDISSGFLHLAGDSLVPESITKTCLEDAIVLQQVDKKFIPIVAGKTLAVIDQHAADERIRLEELRQKVFSGEAKTITFLEAEQELTLPEIGHQLLHNYAEQIKEWGWICNIHSQDSRSFKRSLNLFQRQPTAITLTAVPCILGVNLTDVDLMEFLQQLADTDGSSMIPPSVLRILNSKACRGAIMFGDSLLPSECSLLISELKQTSLCFQCAHGRPTTAPLVNLEALHKQIAKMALLNDDSSGLWHGLRRNQLSLERAQQRLFVAT